MLSTDILERKPRLRAIAALVPEDCQCLADIGTDHGYLPAALLRAGRCRRAIAADIGAAPLERARQTARLYGLEDRMELRLGGGLSVLAPGEAEVIVIAGMGGDNITDILSAAPWCREGILLLLQPMSRAEVLRQWLWEQNFHVRSERLVQDKGVLYPIVEIRGGVRDRVPYTEADAWGGMGLERDPLWGRYLETAILRLQRAAAGLERARDPALAERRERFLRISAELEKRKGAWRHADCARD